MEPVESARYVGLTLNAAKDLAVSEHQNYCVVNSDGRMRTPANRVGSILVLYSDAAGKVVRAESRKLPGYGDEHRGDWWHK